MAFDSAALRGHAMVEPLLKIDGSRFNIRPFPPEGFYPPSKVLRDIWNLSPSVFIGIGTKVPRRRAGIGKNPFQILLSPSKSRISRRALALGQGKIEK